MEGRAPRWILDSRVAQVNTKFIFSPKPWVSGCSNLLSPGGIFLCFVSFPFVDQRKKSLLLCKAAWASENAKLICFGVEFVNLLWPPGWLLVIPLQNREMYPDFITNERPTLSSVKWHPILLKPKCGWAAVVGM